MQDTSNWDSRSFNDWMVQIWNEPAVTHDKCETARAHFR